MAEDGNEFGVALVGCGTVGGAVAALLTDGRAGLRARCGRDIRLRHVIDVDFTNAKRVGVDESICGSDLQVALDDPAVGCIIELVGGTTVAKEIVERSLRAGKPVVTANKALLAAHGRALHKLAREHGACLGFEASCAGGIPIVGALTTGLIANRIDALYGIVNGTCNFILTAMTGESRPYTDALADAQARGFAEADPTLDVSGGDSAHKLAILAGLAFGVGVELDAIDVTGIDGLDLQDIQYGQELGYVIKLLAIAQRQADGVSLLVRPAFIPREHPLAWVSGPFNAVSVYGHATGHTMYYGRGAGGMPTASAVLADVVSVAVGAASRQFASLPLWPDVAPAADVLPVERARSRYYLRVMAEDRPGVLAQFAAVLGKHGISISSVLQREPPADSEVAGVPVVISTHTAIEGNVRRALAEVDALDVIEAPSVCISIVDEHPERMPAAG